MTKYLRILFLLSLTQFLYTSCEVKNQFTDKESKETVSRFSDEHLNFVIDLSDFTEKELTVDFKISSISKSYKIDSLSLTLHDNNNNDINFGLLKIKTYDAKYGGDKPDKEFKDFTSATPDRKLIDENISGYYAIDHTFSVPKVNATKEYRIDVYAKFTTKDSSYIMTKSIIFKRSKHFVAINWGGC